MDDKQQSFYKRLLINIRVKCLKQGIKKSEFCLKQGRKISDICLKQGQGNRGRAAPSHRGMYRVHPPGGRGNLLEFLHKSNPLSCLTAMVSYQSQSNAIHLIIVFDLVEFSPTQSNGLSSIGFDLFD